MAKDKKDSKYENAGGVLFVGAMFIGIGAGFYFDQVTVGTLVGMGVGFLLMALTQLQKK